MKRIVLMIIFGFILSSCTTRTDYGPCVGIADEKDPNLTYKVSAWNLVIGIFFMGLVAPPVFVLVDEFYCPVGNK
jgi:hypothetical protein